MSGRENDGQPPSSIEVSKMKSSWLIRLLGPATAVALLTLVWLVAPNALISIDSAAPAKIAFNDNREPAGNLSGGTLELELEIRRGDWHLLGEDEPAGEVLAFAEAGESPSIPGPLIRVPVGTALHVTVTNLSDTLVMVHGLHARRNGELQPLRVPAGGTREVRFMADVPDTYFYWGAATDRPLSSRPFEDGMTLSAPRSRPILFGVSSGTCREKGPAAAARGFPDSRANCSIATTSTRRSPVSGFDTKLCGWPNRRAMRQLITPPRD